MLKGRLLRQEAINLEIDQKTGSIVDETGTNYLDLSKGTDNVTVTHKSLPPGNKAGHSTVNASKTIKESVIRLPDLKNDKQGRDHKLQKRVIFSKRFNSSPSNFGVCNSINIRHRAKSADAPNLDRQKIDKNSFERIEKDTLTLDEAVHEFLLHCHRRRSGDTVSLGKCEAKRTELNEIVHIPGTGKI